ncbi:hypothetical protein HD806DRAFT_519148 [Xylariaceae sp. AK1471]|nr:hypothetical protein HD806DRAFT_519148 [Xylariaceae sp. AK1471]
MSDAKLSPRYEIRPLELEHLDWAKAVFAHSFIFGSPIWRNLYPSDTTARFYGLYRASHYLIKFQISSGLSLGIFDTSYEFKDAESAASGGKLYFDVANPTLDEHELLQQMDIPLVSIACAYDAFYDLDHRQIAPVMGCLPASTSFYEALAKREPRGPQTCRPTAQGQVLQRMGTATRTDAEGVGFMKAMAHHMMRLAADKGFRRIQIECFHDAVTSVWANPPVPFRGSVASEINTYTLVETDEDGRQRFPYRPIKQRLARVYVTLK